MITHGYIYIEYICAYTHQAHERAKKKQKKKMFSPHERALLGAETAACPPAASIQMFAPNVGQASRSVWKK